MEKRTDQNSNISFREFWSAACPQPADQKGLKALTKARTLSTIIGSFSPVANQSYFLLSNSRMSSAEARLFTPGKLGVLYGPLALILHLGAKIKEFPSIDKLCCPQVRI